MNNNDEITQTKGVHASLIIEVLGRPPEHLTQTLENIIKSIDNEKGVSVKGKKLHDPKLVKNKKDFYSSFAEIEIEIVDIVNLEIIILKYMPSHIEIISPEWITLQNNGISEIFNILARKLHEYDEVARILQMQKAELEKKLSAQGAGENKK